MSSSGISPRVPVAHTPGLGKIRGFDFENRVSSSAAYSSFDLGILSVCVNLSVTPFAEPQTKSKSVTSRVKHKKIFRMTTNLGVTQAPSCFSVDRHRLCAKYALERKIDFRKIRRSCGPARSATCGRNTSFQARRSKSLTLRGEALEVGVEVLTHTSTRAPKRRTGRQKRRTGRRTG